MKELPSDFLRLVQEQYGEDLAREFCAALSSTEPEVSVRLNRWKCPVGHFPQDQPVAWCPDAFYLSERPSFTFDPLFHAGTYYVQEASSMFLAQVLQQYVSEPVVALDLCAAPGGKSTLLRSLLPEDSLLVSNEPIRQRAQILAENTIKWGHPSVVVSQNYPADFTPLENFFDLVLADVPCSGEGMFRKDEEAIREWSLQNVEQCRLRQRDILEAVWPTLKPGGLLVYSTCTFNRQEDEENVHWICHHLGAEELPIAHSAEWGIEGQHHFLPGKARGEGFFLALLRKAEESGEKRFTFPKAGKDKRMSHAPQEPKSLREWVKGDFAYVLQNDTYTAFPAAYAEHLAVLQRHLHLLVFGVQIAEQKGRDWVPSHALAMSKAFRSETFPQVELSYEDSIAYLRRESIQIEAPRGIVLLCHQGFPLGFAKNLGNRANNLYPQEWRIRSQFPVSET